jgi:hypothetical protein
MDLRTKCREAIAAGMTPRKALIAGLEWLATAEPETFDRLNDIAESDRMNVTTVKAWGTTFHTVYLDGNQCGDPFQGRGPSRADRVLCVYFATESN